MNPGVTNGESSVAEQLFGLAFRAIKEP